MRQGEDRLLRLALTTSSPVILLADSWRTRIMSFTRSDVYRETVDRAALMLLAALRDHIEPQFSSIQLEAIRLRGDLAREGHGSDRNKVRAVISDIRQRATDLLSAELEKSGVADDVGAEMERVLQRLLNSIEQTFVSR